jgi:putative intracellular protease/amidase
MSHIVSSKNTRFGGAFCQEIIQVNKLLVSFLTIAGLVASVSPIRARYQAIGQPPKGPVQTTKGSHQGQPSGGPFDWKKNVAILVFNNVQIIDYAGPYEALGYQFNVYLVAEKPGPIRTVMNMDVMPHYSFDDCPKPDILIVPGGMGTMREMKNPKLIKWIQDNAKDSEIVMSVCTGSDLLASAGLLEGLEATGNADGLERLHRLAPTAKIVFKRYADSGKIITTGGLSSGIDGAIHIIERIKGRGWAQVIAHTMEYNWQPDSTYTAATSAQKYMSAFSFILFSLNGEPKIFQGDTDRWEAEALVQSESSGAVLFQKIESLLKERNKWIKQDSAGNNAYKFIDEHGRPWDGWASVQPVKNEKNKYLVVLKVARKV